MVSRSGAQESNCNIYKVPDIIGSCPMFTHFPRYFAGSKYSKGCICSRQEVYQPVQRSTNLLLFLISAPATAEKQLAKDRQKNTHIERC